MVATLYHCLNEETEVVVFFQNPVYDVPDCDNTWDGDATDSSEIGDKEAQCCD